MTLNETVLAAGLAAVISLGASSLALAHGPGGGSGDPYCGSHRGWHMGPMMGTGYGMGQGMGPGMMQPLRQDLTAADVQHMMEHRLAWQGNPNLKVGTVEEKDDDTIVAEIVTQDGSLVQRLEVDRHTGWTRPAQ